MSRDQFCQRPFAGFGCLKDWINLHANSSSLSSILTQASTIHLLTAVFRAKSLRCFPMISLTSSLLQMMSPPAVETRFP